jgi:hypothetical protein
VWEEGKKEKLKIRLTKRPLNYERRAKCRTEDNIANCKKCLKESRIRQEEIERNNRIDRFEECEGIASVSRKY